MCLNSRTLINYPKARMRLSICFYLDKRVQKKHKCLSETQLPVATKIQSFKDRNNWMKLIQES
jgi:hypothetical protein